jgi:hypothetical protein
VRPAQSVRPARRTTPLLVLAAVAVLGGCTTEPLPSPAPTPTAGGSPLVAVDPDLEALEGLRTELRDTVTALRSELEGAATGDMASLREAAGLLVADPDAVTDVPDDGGNGSAQDTAGDQDDDPAASADGTPPTVDPGEPAPILPGPLVSRSESIQYGDLLTRTLAAARGAGTNGEPVLRFLAEPLAGDLGAWQRAAGDQLDAIARAGTSGDLATTEVAILELSGEAPRALAWVVHGLTVPADAEDAAGRALAHLAIIELALDQLE